MNRVLSFTIRVTPKVGDVRESAPSLKPQVVVSAKGCADASVSSGVPNAGLAEAIHFGVTCDGSNQNPLLGLRFHKIGHNYDLNAACFAALPPAEQKLYECIPYPGAQPFPIQGPLPTQNVKHGRWRCGRGRGRGRGRGLFPPCVRRQFQKPRPGLSLSFIKDLTIEDGATILAGENFEKAWLVDTGSSSWPEGCALIHVGGDLLGAKPVIPVKAQKPNSKVKLSVNFTAPSQPGRYRSRWRMINPKGKRFGHALWAVVEVSQGVQQPSGKLTVPVDLQLVNGSRATLLPRNIVRNCFAVHGRGRSHFATVTAPALSILDQTQGKWMYEVILQTDGCMQIGFCTPRFDGKPWRGSGVGDDHHSWAIDCQRLLKWHGEKSTPYARRWGKDGWAQWKVGDVIGCIFDADKGEISFAWNGHDLGMAFSVPAHHRPLFPAVSLSSGQGVQFVLEGPIQFPIKEASPIGEILLQTTKSPEANIPIASGNEKPTGDKGALPNIVLYPTVSSNTVTIESVDAPEETIS